MCLFMTGREIERVLLACWCVSHQSFLGFLFFRGGSRHVKDERLLDDYSRRRTEKEVVKWVVSPGLSKLLFLSGFCFIFHERNTACAGLQKLISFFPELSSSSRKKASLNQSTMLLFLFSLFIFLTPLKTSAMEISNKLALGAGCYWGTEKFIVKDFQKQYPNSIQKASVGFMSPDPNAMKNPSYRQVCSGQTGHVEVLYVELNDPAKHLEPLLKFFFQFHDPTTRNRQGNDVGTQYASIIFCDDNEQKKVATKVRDELQALVDARKVKYAGKEITTAIVDGNAFYPAHEEHQEYLMKNPNGYCNHYYRFKGDWPSLK